MVVKPAVDREIGLAPGAEVPFTEHSRLPPGVLKLLRQHCHSDISPTERRGVIGFIVLVDMYGEPTYICVYVYVYVCTDQANLM